MARTAAIWGKQVCIPTGKLTKCDETLYWETLQQIIMIVSQLVKIPNVIESDTEKG